MKSQLITFPETIGVFVFKKHLKRLPSRSGFVDFALYESPFGEKAFAKRVMKSADRNAVKLLLREADHLEILQSVAYRSRRSIPSHLAHIRIPRVLSFVEEKDFSLLLTSYVNGFTLHTKQEQDVHEVFPQIYDYFQFLYGHMTEFERNSFPQRSAWLILMSYPWLWLKAWWMQPSFRRLLRKSIFVFIKGIPSLLGAKKHSLSHRDLHPKNIVKNESTLSIVDFPYASITVSEYDPLVTLSSIWNSYVLREEMFSYISAIRGKDMFYDSYVRALMVYIVTLFFTSTNFSPEKKNNYEQFLSYAIQPNEQYDPLSFSFLKRLFSIIPAYLHSTIHYASGKRKTQSVPEQIGTYRLKEAISKHSYPFTIGIYEDDQGNPVIGKVWVGKRYSVHAFNLLHEAIVYKTLTAIQRRVAEHIPASLHHIAIPEYKDHLVQKDCIAVFMEQANGQPITETMSADEQFQAYKKVINYLHFLGDYATPEERESITCKSRSYYLSIYPIIFTVAILRHISHLSELALGLYSFINSLQYMNQHSLRLSHGDLHTDNILQHNDTLTVVDLEQGTFTYPEFDTVATLSSRRSSAEFRALLKQETDGLATNRKIAERLAGVGAFISTFNLTSNLSTGHTIHYASILKYLNEFSVDRTTRINRKDLRMN